MDYPVMDPAVVADVLSKPPFVAVEGVFNLRDFGGYPVAAPAGARVKSGLLLRSGEPSRMTPRGGAQLRELGVTTVFDLRSPQEIAAYKSSTPAVAGVRFVSAPILEEVLDPAAWAIRLQGFAADEAKAFVGMYKHILERSGSGLELVLLHLRDHPDEGCLLNCTAGKDRTGVFAAVILSLAGASDEDIAKDYALSELGLQPLLPILMERFQKTPSFRDNWEGTINLANAKPASILALLKLLRDQWGGVRGYLKTHTSLTDEDFDRIRANLVVS